MVIRVKLDLLPMCVLHCPIRSHLQNTSSKLRFSGCGQQSSKLTWCLFEHGVLGDDLGHRSMKMAPLVRTQNASF